jgi:SAM-dependent methyltransferase
MEPQVYQDMHRLQKDHWWFCGQRFLTADLIRRFVKVNRQSKILDAGCGTGAMLKLLQGYGWTAGLDYNETPLRFCRMDSNNILCRGSISTLPFKDNTFDLITVSDVLYHRLVEDDNLAIKEIHRCLKQGGTAIFREPAFDFLMRKHDIVEHTGRRYTLPGFKAKIREAGFKIKDIFYANNFLFPAVLLVKFKERFLESKEEAGSDLAGVPPWLNKILIIFYKIEVWLLRKIRFPFGVSVVCVVTKA